MRFIFHFDQIQASRGERRRRQTAITRLQQGRHPLGRALSLTNVDQAANQIPNHVVQKRAGFEIEHDDIARAPDHGAPDRLDRRLCLATGSTERGEIMFAEQQRRAMQVRAVFAPGSDSTVLYGVRMANPSLRLCYQRELRTRPSAEGVISARFRIGADGRVSNTTTRGLFSDEMLRCVSQRIQAVRFAARAQALDTYVRLILHPSP